MTGVRIAHFTDLHFSPERPTIAYRHLLSKRTIGWLSLWLGGRSRAFARTGEVVRAFVRDVQQLEPDHIVFTGDVTSMSLEAEFELARDALAPMLQDERVTGIPGNHDVYVPSALRGGVYERFFGAWTRTDLRPADFGDSVRESHPFPLVRLVGDDTALVCLRDVRPTWLLDSSGRVPALQLAALEHVLKLPCVRDRVKILALHYALRLPDGRPDRYLHRLRNAREVERIARERGVSLVIHGHVHHRYVHRPTPARPFATANPGSLSLDSRERAYHVLTIRERAIDLEARRYDPQSDAFEPWPAAPGCGTIWLS